MKTTAAFLLGVLSTALVAAAPRAPSKYVDATYGFSIEAPAFPAAPKGGTCSPAFFFAPAQGGFATNVNVQIQENGMGIRDFVAGTKKEMEPLAFTYLEDREVVVSGQPGVRFEYKGKIENSALHWAALAVAARGRIYLVTATCTEAAWPQHEKALRACLDSFALTELTK
jgi:hypothetical protein